MASPSGLSRRELVDLLGMARRVAGEAAGFLRDLFGLEEYTTSLSRHGYDSDESLRVDVESEKYIIDLLKAEGFNGSILGEEQGLVRLGSDPLIAVVDPLDGSKNYASFIPWSAVSIAFAVAPKDREPVLSDVVAGAVAPVYNWPVVSFARGMGVYEGGSKASPRKPPSPVILAYFEDTLQARVVERLVRVSPGKPVRSLGSASLEIAWTGMGRAEVFIDVRSKLRVVDVAAAAWIAVELGSLVLVENPAASLTRVEKVGSVVVAAPATENLEKLRGILEAEGYSVLLEKRLAP